MYPSGPPTGWCCPLDELGYPHGLRCPRSLLGWTRWSARSGGAISTMWAFRTCTRTPRSSTSTLPREPRPRPPGLLPATIGEPVTFQWGLGERGVLSAVHAQPLGPWAGGRAACLLGPAHRIGGNRQAMLREGDPSTASDPLRREPGATT